MYEQLKQRYLRGYLRKDQLVRYVALGKLTEVPTDPCTGVTENQLEKPMRQRAALMGFLIDSVLVLH